MKSLILVTAVTALLGVGCAKDSDSNSAPGAATQVNGQSTKASYQPACPRPFEIAVKDGEEKIEGGITTQDGLYELESAKFFAQSEDSEASTIAGSFENGAVSVDCHTSTYENTATSKKTSRVSGDFTIPSLLDLNNDVLVENAKIGLSAVNGVTSTSYATEKSFAALPKVSNPSNSNSVLVRDGQGRLILRFTYAMGIGENRIEFAAEAVYRQIR